MSVAIAKYLVPLVWLVSLVTIPGCDGDNGTGPSQNPEISDLQVARSSPTTFVFQFQSFDEQADVFNGTCTVESNIGSLVTPINQVGPGGDPNSQSSTITCVLTLGATPASGLTFAGNVFVTDQGGHESNRLPFSIVTESTRGGSTGGAPQLTPGSARLGR